MDATWLPDWLVRALFVLPLLVASYTDITRYRIPNWLCLTMLLLFPFAQIVAPYPAPYLPHLLTGTALLALGLMLFIPGLLGGGDAKLLAVCGLWLGPAATPAALVLTAFTGGLLSLLLLSLRALGLPGKAAVLRPGAAVPYGLAIAASGILLSGRLPMLGP